MKDKNALIMKMAEYYAGQPARIQHFTKVFAYAKMIGESEGMPKEELDTLETAAIVHDIGIKVSEEKYGDASGKHQEEEGPAVAKEMLLGMGYDPEMTERVCFLVGHHHTYTNIDALDYQILVEADFLVNLLENAGKYDAAKKVYDTIFRTETGKKLCRLMFL